MTTRQQIAVTPYTRNRPVAIEKVLIPIECATCQIDFAIGDNFMRRRREDHQGFYCPNGHSNVYNGPNEEEKLRKKLERTEQQLGWSQDSVRAYSQRLETERRRTAAYKGQLTKLRRRIANGVCPVAGCKRSFDSGRDPVLRHMHDQHESWVTEHAKLLADAGVES